MSDSERAWPAPDARRLRVCLQLDTMGYDAGTEKLVAELAKRLDFARFDLHICCFEDSARLQSLPSPIKKQVFPLVRLYSGSGVRQIMRFRRYLKQQRIDVVHGFMTKSNIFAVLGGVHSTCRCVVTSRFNIGYWYTPRLLRLFRILNRLTTHILANSLSAKNTTVRMEGVSPEKISVFYPGVDLAQYGPSGGDAAAADAFGVPGGVQVVGITATFRPVKDLPLFLRAAALVLEAAPQTAFLLVGHGQMKEELETLATELGIRQNVFITNGEGRVPDHLARMTVACLTSKSESLPNAILEYMAAGLPVVATDVGGIPEFIEDGINGFLVRERTPEAVAAPIIRLLTDEALRGQMGQRNLERSRTELDMSVAVKRLEEFYQRAAAEAAGMSKRPMRAS